MGNFANVFPLVTTEERWVGVGWAAWPVIANPQSLEENPKCIAIEGTVLSAGIGVVFGENPHITRRNIYSIYRSCVPDT